MRLEGHRSRPVFLFARRDQTEISESQPKRASHDLGPACNGKRTHVWFDRTKEIHVEPFIALFGCSLQPGADFETYSNIIVIDFFSILQCAERHG